MISALICVVKILVGITAFWAGFKRITIAIINTDIPVTAQGFAVVVCGVLVVWSGYDGLWGVMS